jgi:hypothetical protein
MKLLRYSSVAVVVVGLLGGSASGQYFGARAFAEGDSRIILAIRPDGSGALTNETVQPRKSLEMQVAAWERSSNFAEGLGSEDENAAPAPAQPAKPEQKTLTDEELASKLREMYQEQGGFGGDAATEIERVEVSTNSVRLVTRRGFGSLKELLGQGVYSWGPNLLMFEEARFETDTNHNLRIIFTPAQNAARYGRTVGAGWKAARMKFEWKLALPGKILSSGLPGTEGNETWLRLDGQKPETVDAALRLVGAPLVITAELDGLKLDEPLESRKLVRRAWRQANAEPDLPIIDAGPGFQAEPVSLTISTVHYFPEGKEHFKNGPQAAMFGMESPGMVVSAKLFPPKGREIKSVTGLRVKAAKDDRGRAISMGAEDNEDTESYSQFSRDPNEPDQSGAARVQLRLGLPAPDAQTIEQIEAEAVVLTIGGWKEMLLTNVQADAKKEIDLGEVLPGAKLIVKRIRGGRTQTIVEARLEGPAGVNQLEVKIKSTSRRGGPSNTINQRATTSGKVTARNLILRAFDFERGQGGERGRSDPPTLLVRCPQDVKRERLQFKLTTLDLL